MLNIVQKYILAVAMILPLCQSAVTMDLNDIIKGADGNHLSNRALVENIKQLRQSINVGSEALYIKGTELREGVDPLRLRELDDQVDICGGDCEIWIMGGQFSQLIEKIVESMKHSDGEEMLEIDGRGQEQIGDFTLSWGPVANGNLMIDLSHGDNTILQTGGLKRTDGNNIGKVIALFTKIAKDTTLRWDEPIADE